MQSLLFIKTKVTTEDKVAKEESDPHDCCACHWELAFMSDFCMGCTQVVLLNLRLLLLYWASLDPVWSNFDMEGPGSN